VFTFLKDGLISVLLCSAVKNLVQGRQHQTTLKESIYRLTLAMHSLIKLKIEKGGCTDLVAVNAFLILLFWLCFIQEVLM
jgi:hypothetical protein